MSESHLGNKTDKNMSQDNGEQKRRRRPRSDQQGRNFSCSCGKSYLSYPALYTHIKTKHNGKAQFNRTTPAQKQQNEQDPKQEEDDQTEKMQDAKNMELLKKYLNKFFPFVNRDKETEKKVKDLGKDDLQYLKSIKEYWDRHKKEEEYHQEQTFSTTIDNVLGRFLVDIEHQLSKNAQKFLEELVINLRNAVNSLEKNDKYCRTNSASGLPAMMNSIFEQNFLKMEEGHLYSKHPTLPCKVLYHFNRWLFQEKFTNSSLRFNIA